MSFVCAKCTLHGLGTTVAAELSCHIDRLVREYLEDLQLSGFKRSRTNKKMMHGRAGGRAFA